VPHTRDSIQSKIGQELGVSDWVEIDQARIDAFAKVTEDHQFIHVDPEAAKHTPFGGTIAHGFLVVSLLSRMAAGQDFLMDGAMMVVNYGFEKVRMVAPVRSGKRIRGRFVLKDAVERSPKQWLITLGVTVEIEGEDKPALAAEWLSLQVTA
jgi:acyl dehydratase